MDSYSRATADVGENNEPRTSSIVDRRVRSSRQNAYCQTYRGGFCLPLLRWRFGDGKTIENRTSGIRQTSFFSYASDPEACRTYFDRDPDTVAWEVISISEEDFPLTYEAVTDHSAESQIVVEALLPGLVASRVETKHMIFLFLSYLSNCRFARTNDRYAISGSVAHFQTTPKFAVHQIPHIESY